MAKRRVNAFFQKIPGVFTYGLKNGPWRSKSVLAALAVVVVGMGFWFSDIKHDPQPGETNSAAAGAAGVASSNPAGAPAGSHWHWSKPFPFYVRMGVSYVAGYCIGWFFRRLTRLIIIVVALAVGLLAYGKLAGCNLTHAQEEVQRGGEWAQHETTTAENYLRHILPSVTAGGAGIFPGFRRRSQAATPKPAA